MSRTIVFLIPLVIILIGAIFVNHIVNDKNSNTETSISPSQSIAMTDFQNWRPFSAPDEHFKVLLPSLPQHAKERIPDPLTRESRKYDTFVANDSSGSVFMINVITLPRDINNAVEEVLKAMIDEILSRNKDNKLQSMDSSTFRDFQALDFTMVNGEIMIAGKVFADGKTLYILTMGNNSTSFNIKKLEFFINSFEILDKKNK